MTPAHRILATAIRPAPIGLRFRDVATGLPVRDGLTVTVTPTRNPRRKIALDRNGQGVWYAHRFPGLSDTALAATGDWATIAQPCRVDAVDTLGRFQPLAIDLDLPARGLIDWPGWAALPQGPLAPLTERDDTASPPRSVVCPDQLPLFATAARSAPAPLAEVRAQLARHDTGAPAAWALLTASHAGRVRGIGQADAEGRVVLFFAYPERPRPSLATSPPAITDFRWSIDLIAYWDGLGPSVVPTLAAVMDQLNHPRDLFADTRTPSEMLPSQLMNLGKPLVLRTAQTPDGPSSLLMMRAS